MSQRQISPEEHKKRTERRYLKFLQSLGITCYGNPKQKPLKDLYPSANVGDHLELDIIGIEGETGIIVEVTTQTDKNRKKIEKFLRSQ